MMVEVFKTNVFEPSVANSLLQLLAHQFPGSRISFDLEDCDKVLRVEGDNICADIVMQSIQDEGFECVILVS